MIYQEIRHVISSEQFANIDLVEQLFSRATELKDRDKKRELPKSMEGLSMTYLFYEPSTRTRLSFIGAMKKLGGMADGTESARVFSSVTKGETLEDSIIVVSNYSDVIVLRYDKKGGAERAAKVSKVPILNAGDGTGEHPTQFLLDLYTIGDEFKNRGNNTLERLKGLKIALVGDLKYGRTVHSLVKAAHTYFANGNKIYLVSPDQLRLPDEYKSDITSAGIIVEELKDWNKILPEVDVLYMTRVQKERFESEEEYEKVKGSYIFDEPELSIFNPNGIIMHPLPRAGEISFAVDRDPRAAYFRQAENGLYVRMALLEEVTGYNRRLAA